MVVFTCNNCGETLQKPRVAKHYQFGCRSVPFLTCVDCLKDFRGEEYTEHTKCITEAERYGGKDYISKPNANKGEKKQQAWLNVVQNLLDNSKNLSGAEKSLLKTISKYENIPRKKAKFLNFIRNAVGNVTTTVIESTWDKIEAANKNNLSNNNKNEGSSNGTAESNCKEDQNISTSEERKENNIAENENNENIVREKKSKNKKKKAQIEENNADTQPVKHKKETQVEENNTDTQPTKHKKETQVEENNTDTQPAKHKKETQVVENNTDTQPAKHKKKSRKRDLSEQSNQVEQPSPKKKCVIEADNDTNLLDTCKNVQEKPAFDWKNTILSIVSAKKVISLNKLQKKVLTQYINHCSDTVPYEKGVSKFNKKLKKISEIVISEEKVRLA